MREGHGISGLEALQYDESMRPLFVVKERMLLGHVNLND